ncbi:Hypothetical protein CINCED_3A021541, partial [Cinara cedri]
RLSAAFAKLAALDNLRYRTELEMRSHAMNLAVVKRYLFDRCIGMVSVGHQIADDEYRPQNHVRYLRRCNSIIPAGMLLAYTPYTSLDAHWKLIIYSSCSHWLYSVCDHV